MITLDPSAVFLLIFLTAAAFHDASAEKIPNGLVLWAAFPGGFLLGPVFLTRLLLSCALLYPLFRFRLTGAGDVKLLSTMAAWSGSSLFLRFFLLSLLGASVPALLLLLSGRRGARIPMGPFFLLGWILILTGSRNPVTFPVLEGGI